ncbi:hypothetical protein SCHPADRAFT_885843 [Schizopora paradoxa]|uniref:Uncharacterized protein n=1 Tax=Schizopora paradoxa TaxID=27342 RepID=A0A0H2S4X5_9AGAM|nr:hypothetical protein SCHPADRAFT_885843 [Schizopora paradoxa]
MSVLLSISSVLSFLSFLTTVLALARVGAAAFATNQSQMQQQLQRLQLVASGGDSNGLLLPRGSQLGLADADEKGVANDLEKLKGLVSAGELMRIPSNWGPMRRPRLAFPPAALLDEPQQPLSMAKLIMSRHSHRRPSRSPQPRRPPGLASSALPRSRLVEGAVV